MTTCGSSQAWILYPFRTCEPPAPALTKLLGALTAREFGGEEVHPCAAFTRGAWLVSTHTQICKPGELNQI